MAKRHQLVSVNGAAELEKTLKQLPGNGMLVVQGRAVNKTLKGARTEAVKLVRQSIALNASDTRKSFSVIRARYGRNSGYKSAAGFLDIKGKPYPLARYPFRPKQPPSQKGVPVASRKPATVQVLKRGHRKVVEHGFVAKMQSGHVGVFIRDGEPRKMSRGRYQDEVKQPIRELHGPAPAPYFRRDIMLRRLAKRVRPRLQKNMQHELDYYILQQFRRMAGKGRR
jgi:hypothetical protein